jgi:hypothetical protein
LPKTNYVKFGRFSVNIPKPIWTVGFALEQSLRDATVACSNAGILKSLEYTPQTLTIRNNHSKKKFFLVFCPLLRFFFKIALDINPIFLLLFANIGMKAAKRTEYSGKYAAAIQTI